jgi:hypothetical protein
MLRSLAFAAAVTVVASCLVIADFEVEPPLPLASEGGHAGDGGFGGGGAGGLGGVGGTGGTAGQGGDCSPSCVLVEYDDLVLGHIDIEEGDNGRIYFTANHPRGGQVHSIEKDGTNDVVLLDAAPDDSAGGGGGAPPGPDCDYIKLGDARVYFTSYFQGGVRSLFKSGGFEQIESDDPPIVAGLFVVSFNGDHLYWHIHDGAGIPRYREPNAAVADAYFVAQNHSFGMAVDPANPADMYWSTWGDLDFTGSVVWRPNSGVLHTIVTGSPKTSGIALDTTHVYWIDGDGSVWRNPRGDPESPTTAPPAAIEQLAQGAGDYQGFGAQIVLDDTYVYWGCAGGLYRATKVPSAMPAVAGTKLLDVPRVGDLAADHDTVYALADGALIKVPKR